MKVKLSDAKQLHLQKKLSSINDIVELKKIYSNVDQQNSTLRQDILTLKYKVDILMQKQKSKPLHHNKEDQFKIRELQAQQKQLKLQYRLMQELKKRQFYQKQEKGTEQIIDHKLKIENQLKNVEQQISLLKTQITDFKNETIRLQKTIQLHEEQQDRNKPKIEQFNRENQELRRKVLMLKKKSTEREYESMKTMDSMYTMKIRYKNGQLSGFLDKKRSSSIKEQLSKEDILNLPELQKEVEQLKKVVKKKEKEHVQIDIVNNRLREELTQKNKQDVKQLKELQQRKHRLVHQLNKYKKALQRHIENQNNNKNLKQYNEQGIDVVQYSNPQVNLRKDFAGILGGKVLFDDRLALKENIKSFMIGFFIYQVDHASSTKNLLVAIRIIYDVEQANTSNAVPLPGHYLSKCKMSKYTLGEGDFIKLFKVKYSSNENRIIKIQIRTNKNNRYEFGDKRSFSQLAQGQNVYGFDISIQEYPVSLFGSYNYGRSHWHLQSLGVEINDL